MNGVVLMFEDDGHGMWVAEAQRRGVPYAEASGDTPLNAVTALAQTLAAMVSDERASMALDRVETAQSDAAVTMTAEQAAEVRRAKERLEAKRAAAST